MNYKKGDIITISRPLDDRPFGVTITRVFDPKGDNGDYILAGIKHEVGVAPRTNPVWPWEEILVKSQWIHGHPKWVQEYESSSVPLYRIITRYSEEVEDNRTRQDILTHAMTEMGELALEVQIQEGKSYKDPSQDGVVGEAMDVIICMMDLIHRHDPSMTYKQLSRIAQAKCEKWLDKHREMTREDC